MGRDSATQLCRICHNGCPIIVEIEDDRVVAIRGDRESPLHRGYLCPKGMSLPALHNDPRRLLHPLKRDGSGELVPVALEQALDEIVDRLAGLLDEGGPRSVMGYASTGIQPQVVLSSVLTAFLRSIGKSSSV
jgi:anaerobic selenocysteine-containing dehydrogenase